MQSDCFGSSWSNYIDTRLDMNVLSRCWNRHRVSKHTQSIAHKTWQTTKIKFVENCREIHIHVRFSLEEYKHPIFFSFKTTDNLHSIDLFLK